MSIFQIKRMFFSNKQNLKHIFLRRAENQKMKMKNDERTMFEIFFKNQEEIQEKTILVTLEKDILFGEKFFFRKSKIDNGQKKKKDGTKRRRKTKEVSEKR